MKNSGSGTCKRLVLTLIIVGFCTMPAWGQTMQPYGVMASGGEMQAIYGMKGYAYTYSPLPINGYHFQTGAMYSKFDGKIENRDGDIWVVPFGFSFGDGKGWEMGVAGHWEKWDNSDQDASEKGLGDVFIGAKVRLMAMEDQKPFDLSVLPYVMIPTGNHDKWIGDLYMYNPTDNDDYSLGGYLLIGRRWDQLYLSGSVGYNHIDTDMEYIENNTFSYSVTVEYLLSQSWNSYIEFFNNENKNLLECEYCEGNVTDDMREIGAGLLWMKDEWGIKMHIGTGLTDTSPNIRFMGLINRIF